MVQHTEKVGAQRVNKTSYWFSHFRSYKFSHNTDNCLDEILNYETDSESISHVMSKISYTNLLLHQIKSSYGQTFLFDSLDDYEYPYHILLYLLNDFVFLLCECIQYCMIISTSVPQHYAFSLNFLISNSEFRFFFFFLYIYICAFYCLADILIFIRHLVFAFSVSVCFTFFFFHFFLFHFILALLTVTNH